MIHTVANLIEESFFDSSFIIEANELGQCSKSSPVTFFFLTRVLKTELSQMCKIWRAHSKFSLPSPGHINGKKDNSFCNDNSTQIALYAFNAIGNISASALSFYTWFSCVSLLKYSEENILITSSNSGRQTIEIFWPWTIWNQV